MRDRVSIIVPVYNSEKYIRRCIESILKQTYAEIELILVDDGSTDHSRERCLYYAEIDDRVVVLHQQNQGASAARNSGLKYAKGEYILFVDSDDWIEEDLLETMIAKNAKYQVEAVVFGWKCEGNDTACYQITEKDIILRGREIINTIIDDDLAYGGGYTWNKLWNRSVLKINTGFFDENLYTYEDKIFAIKNYLEVNRVAIVSDVCYHYLIREGSLSRPYNSDQYWKAKENVLLAHRKMAEICDVDSRLGHRAYIKYYSMVMQFLASAVKRGKREYMNKAYSILKGHYKDILQYEGWTIFRKIEYGFIFAVIKLYYSINKLGAKV